MKNILLLLFVSATFTILAQITVPETTKSFYGVVEATWCGNCGQYGHPSTESVITQTSPKAIYVQLHASTSSQLHSPTATLLSSAFGLSGQPVFSVNAANFGGYTGTVVNSVVTEINSYYNVSIATVNAGFNYGVVGDTIYAETKTTFFTDLTGEYYVGVYVYEDSIWEWQANYDPGIADMDIWQNHVLRTSLNGHFGAQVVSGAVTTGTSFTQNFKLAIDPIWDLNQIHVFTIVWKKNGSVYEFVNANDIGGTLTGFVGTEDFQTQNISVYPNPTTDIFTIIGVESDMVEGSIFDMLGNKVVEFSDTQVSLAQLPSGVYAVVVKADDEFFYQKIVKE